MLEIKLQSDDLRANLDQLVTRIKDRKALLRQVGEIEKEDIQRRIQIGKRSPSGVPWAPWRPSTAIYRQRKGTASKGLLFDSGALYRSFKLKQDGDQVTVGTNVKYAPYLQFGTPKMNARPFMGLSKEATRSIAVLLDNFINLPRK